MRDFHVITSLICVVFATGSAATVVRRPESSHLKEIADRETAIQDELSAGAVAYLKSKPSIGLAKAAWLWTISNDETGARQFFQEKFVEGVNGGGVMAFMALLKKHGGETEVAFVRGNLDKLIARSRQHASILVEMRAKELATKHE